MKTLTVVGTITKDIIITDQGVSESFGGAPWFANQVCKDMKISLTVVTKVGKDFPLDQILLSVREQSTIDIEEKTTTLNIYSKLKGLPAHLENFTGEIKLADVVAGDIVIASPLLNEISIETLENLQKKFKFVIVDIQGYTRPSYKKHMLLSDSIKKQPQDLEKICKLADLLKFSENEFNVLFNARSSNDKIEALRKLGCKNILITFGKKGCMLVTPQSIKRFKIMAKKNQNILGAGDKLLILTAINLSKGLNLDESIQLAQQRLGEIL